MINESMVVYLEDMATGEGSIKYGLVTAPYIRLRRDTDAIYARRGGVLDAGALIQLAMDDASAGGSNAKEPGVFLPPGTYRCPLGIDLRDRTVLRGSGMAATRLLVPPGHVAVRAYTQNQGGEISRAGVMDLIVRYTDEMHVAAFDGIHAKGHSGARVWKLQIHNVQIYGAGRDAIYLEGVSGGAVAECDFRNIEASHFKRNGMYENVHTYDQFVDHAFFEGAGGMASGFGHRTDGGSGVYNHMHAVACGSNNGSGVLTGGSFYTNSNYNQYFAPHSDRPAGNGFVAGFGNQIISNDFHGALSFNPGVPYANIADGVKSGVCWKIGKVAGLHIIGGQTGALGTQYLACNRKGFLFESADTAGVVISNQTIKNLNQHAVEVAASVPAGRITFRDNLMYQNTGALWTGEAKLVLVNNEVVEI